MGWIEDERKKGRKGYTRDPVSSLSLLWKRTIWPLSVNYSPYIFIFNLLQTQHFQMLLHFQSPSKQSKNHQKFTNIYCDREFNLIELFFDWMKSRRGAKIYVKQGISPGCPLKLIICFAARSRWKQLLRCDTFILVYDFSTWRCTERVNILLSMMSHV